jgi:NAD(P)-dependent dehydrogenase (short-subunit alcohol dehydrogenase family)
MAPTSPDLTGKVVIVTGANAGIGLETACGLADLGATVVLAVRSAERGAAAKSEIERRTGSTSVVVGSLDLASFASIRAFAAWFLDEFDRLDVLVNNAGLILDARRETAEGFEEMFGVNHLGHVLLTSLLLDRLVQSAPSRVVVVSSFAHRLAIGGIRRSDLQHVDGFRGFAVYCHSKLANALYALELARRLEGTGVTVHAVHPGAINSHFGGDGDTGVLGWFIKVFGRVVLRSPRFGARTSILLASSDDLRVAGTTGGYWSWKRRWPPSRRARDRAEAAWLWDESERLIAAGGPSQPPSL